MKDKAIVLMLLYLLGIISFLSIAYLKLYNDLTSYTCLFVIFILINKISLNFIKKRSKLEKIIYITEACFVVYLIFLFAYGNTYFIQYKLLIIPSFVLGAYQSFMLEKVQKQS